MKRAALSIALLTAALPGPALADVLDRARAGEVQCYNPDGATRTCASIGAYRWDEAGRIRNEATVLLSSLPLITIAATSEVRIEGDAVCGRVRAEDIDAGRVLVGGRPTDDNVSGQVIEFAKQSFADILGHDVCTRYDAQADGAMRTRVSLDGVDWPEASSAVMWVRLQDGWRVGAP
jgi:hypothetical protein